LDVVQRQGRSINYSLMHTVMSTLLFLRQWVRRRERRGRTDQDWEKMMCFKLQVRDHRFLSREGRVDGAGDKTESSFKCHLETCDQVPSRNFNQ
jgi:hypothetical protein